MLTGQGLDLHARGNQKISCEAYDRVANLIVTKPGIVMSRGRGKVRVSIPTANNPHHTFSTLDCGGYGYEGSVHSPRGWRIKLSQLDLSLVGEVVAAPPQQG